MLHSSRPNRPKVLLYYFHGLGGTERDFVDEPDRFAIAKYWEENGYLPPAIVSISYGRAHLFAPKNSKKRSGLYELTVFKAMPLIEQKHQLFEKVEKRWLLGVSMGGFNGAQVLLRHPHVFSKAALLCPAFTNIGPYSSRREVLDYIRETGANKTKVMTSLVLARRYFPDEATWKKQSPLELAKAQLPLNMPSVHLTLAVNDEYGFYPGGEVFKDRLLEASVSVDTVMEDRGHCTFTPEKVAEFFVR